LVYPFYTPSGVQDINSVKAPKLNLLQTTAVKLAIKFTLIYGLILGIVISALYWVNNAHIDNKIKHQLEKSIVHFQNSFASGGRSELIKQLQIYQQADEKHIAFLQSETDVKLQGNLHAWPEDIDINLDGKVSAAWVNDEVIPFEIHEDDAYLPIAGIRLSDNSKLLLAHNIEQSRSLLEFTEFLIESMGIAILFSIFITIILGRKIINRMEIISKTAADIMAGDISQRVPLSDKNDEFDNLSMRLNNMLDRIQQLIKGVREVTDNVAHDLRSPLTRMRNQMEITLLETRTPEEYQQVLHNNIEEIGTLVTTFNSLLSIAQTEAGNHRTQWDQVNLKQLAIDLMELYTPLTESKNQTLEVINGNDSYVYGSRDLLAQSFGNLLENAIKYTPHGGNIKLHIKTSDNQVEVIVSDTGPGIPDKEKKHVLEKFVRLESSRHTSGNGLGLSLVAAVAGLHKAKLILKNNNPGLQVILQFNRDNS